MSPTELSPQRPRGVKALRGQVNAQRKTRNARIRVPACPVENTPAARSAPPGEPAGARCAATSTQRVSTDSRPLRGHQADEAPRLLSRPLPVYLPRDPASAPRTSAPDLAPTAL